MTREEYEAFKAWWATHPLTASFLFAFERRMLRIFNARYDAPARSYREVLEEREREILEERRDALARWRARVQAR